MGSGFFIADRFHTFWAGLQALLPVALKCQAFMKLKC